MDSSNLIRLFTIASSDYYTGIIYFIGSVSAKFSFVHILARPSLFIPIMLGLGLKWPNFLNRIPSPEAMSLSIMNAYGLLKLPISDRR